MTLGEYILYWYETYKRMNHAATTAEANLSRIHTHICVSTLGKKELGDISTQEVQEFLFGLSANGNKTQIADGYRYGKPLSNATIAKIRQILISSFRQAEREGKISSNPASGTECIRISHKETRVFTKNETQKLLAYTKNHRYHDAYLLLFATGLRRSELLGLSWDDINSEEHILKVRKTLIVEDGLPVLRNMMKTPKSIRTIPIPEALIQILEKRKSRQMEEEKSCDDWSNSNNLIFTKKNGACLNPTSFSRNFKNILNRIGFAKELHLHSIRHTWATRMVQLGIPLTDIQKIGGWSTSRMLLEIYYHTVQESQRTAMEKMFHEISGL